ncbi:MAG: sigma-70 family RNA polymerase sigma factor [Bacteroidales bacterium]|jgi:RNA polymerase sigma factor (sigma-70 family)|nr:sigma-70 family RNA polymerase sigma factor [Bacteroidales bacterium]
MGEEENIFSSIEILEGIKKHDREILNFVYETYFNQLADFVTKRRGTESDAWDIFQDTMGVIYDYVHQKEFNLEVPFQAFFFTVAQKLWFKHYHKSQKVSNFTNETMDLIPYESNEMLRELMRQQIMTRLSLKYMKKLSPNCLKLIKFSNMDMDTSLIAKKLNYLSNQAVYNQRRKCLRKLLNWIKQDPEYQNLTDYERP